MPADCGAAGNRVGPTLRGPYLWLALACLLLPALACQRSTLPYALSDREFWNLVETLSEPPGTFSVSENLVSNEPEFAERVRILRPDGGVYIGVGPEQNFTYIAALRPAMAFVVDIRRENRSLHLLYKALFETSADRPEFVSRLFSRPRPSGLSLSSGIDEIFAGFDGVPPSSELYKDTLALVRQRLLVTRALPLMQVDLDEIERALETFSREGPEIHFWTGRTDDEAGPTYEQLMTTRDRTGQGRSYLATHEGFTIVKDLHSRNLIVPLVGDFAGPTALQGVGDYIRMHADVVRVFYASNVRVYLTTERMAAFCRNLAALPAGREAMFVENQRMRSLASRLRACATGGS